MNRQIKFRGRRQQGCWYYGSLDLTEREPKICFQDTITDEDSGEVCHFARRVAVDPSTIGQFTGLTDRNGKEIYEGDLIRDTEFTYEVYWCDDIAAFMFEEPQSGPLTPRIYLLSDFCKECEVIGNIHDDKTKEE